MRLPGRRRLTLDSLSLGAVWRRLLITFSTKSITLIERIATRGLAVLFGVVCGDWLWRRRVGNLELIEAQVIQMVFVIAVIMYIDTSMLWLVLPWKDKLWKVSSYYCLSLWVRIDAVSKSEDHFTQHYVEPFRTDAQVVEELVPVGPLFKELVQPTILTKSDCILC